MGITITGGLNIGNGLTLTPVLIPIDFLVVAGGGGGVTDHVGAGGAGGVRYFTSQNIIKGFTYSVTVGAGGGTYTNGNDSSFNNITSTGGGRGAGAAGQPGSTGGSGGGGG